MYSTRVKNYEAISSTLMKIGRRKGKLVGVEDLKDGDIIRFQGKAVGPYNITCACCEPKRNRIFFYDAWAYFGSSPSIGSGGEIKHMAGLKVFRLGSKSEYPEPDREKEMKTLIYRNPDGTVCCQNVVFWHIGQHFKTTPAALDRMVEGDKSREWVEEKDACDCGLSVGQVKSGDTVRLYAELTK